MPAAIEVQRQLELLSKRLQHASSLPKFSHWAGASGTVIMSDVFTQPRFYSGVADYLYLYSHCASKSMCEAVVEGMGGVWDRSADPRRHPAFETGVEEAVIAWSGPQPWHPEATVFISRALAHAFPNGWVKEFVHQDERKDRLHVGHGQVMDRLAQDKPRFPAAAYDVQG